MTAVTFEEWVFWHKGGHCPSGRIPADWWLIGYKNRQKIIAITRKEHDSGRFRTIG